MEIVARFHDEASAEAAKQEFISRFQQGAMPTEIPEVTLHNRGGQLGIAHLLKGAGLVSSTSEAFRMIEQGAVKIDGQRVDDRSLQIKAGSNSSFPGRETQVCARKAGLTFSATRIAIAWPGDDPVGDKTG